MILKVILVATVLLGISFAGIAVKMFVKKDGEFKKSCSSVDPNTGQRLGCSCGGAEEGGSCENRKA